MISASFFIRGVIASQVKPCGVTVMPIFFASAVTARATSLRRLSVAGYMSVNAARRPSLTRMPSGPVFQPAASRVAVAAAGSAAAFPAIDGSAYGDVGGTGPNAGSPAPPSTPVTMACRSTTALSARRIARSPVTGLPIGSITPR